MAKARPRDLAGEGVQGGVRGQEGLEEGLQEGGLGGLQVGAGRLQACCNHLTGTLGGGERLSHIWQDHLHCTFHL